MQYFVSLTEKTLQATVGILADCIIPGDEDVVAGGLIRLAQSYISWASWHLGGAEPNLGAAWEKLQQARRLLKLADDWYEVDGASWASYWAERLRSAIVVVEGVLRALDEVLRPAEEDVVEEFSDEYVELLDEPAEA